MSKNKYSKNNINTLQNKLFDIEPTYPETFCRTCENRVKRTYLHGNKVMQFCCVIKDNRNQFGMRRIKVTTPACELYKLKN